MKSLILLIPMVLLTFLYSACNHKTEICDCFETRLEIKKMIKDSDNPEELIETEEYKRLSAKKKECLTHIEPAYFEENDVQRNGRDDKEFLLEEIEDCPAVKKLLGVE